MSRQTEDTIGSVYSDWVKVIHGILQGSILCSLMFLLRVLFLLLKSQISASESILKIYAALPIGRIRKYLTLDKVKNYQVILLLIASPTIHHYYGYYTYKAYWLNMQNFMTKLLKSSVWRLLQRLSNNLFTNDIYGFY